MTSFCGVVENTIRSKLQDALDTKHLDVINESYMHNVPKSAETHFKVVVVSGKFEGLPLIKVRTFHICFKVADCTYSLKTKCTQGTIYRKYTPDIVPNI